MMVAVLIAIVVCMLITMVVYGSGNNDSKKSIIELEKDYGALGREFKEVEILVGKINSFNVDVNGLKILRESFPFIEIKSQGNKLDFFSNEIMVNPIMFTSVSKKELVKFELSENRIFITKDWEENYSRRGSYELSSSLDFSSMPAVIRSIHQLRNVLTEELSRVIDEDKIKKEEEIRKVDLNLEKSEIKALVGKIMQGKRVLVKIKEVK